MFSAYALWAQKGLWAEQNRILSTMLIFAISIALGEIQRRAGWTGITTQSAVPIEELSK
jgi:hypothetical protein